MLHFKYCKLFQTNIGFEKPSQLFHHSAQVGHHTSLTLGRSISKRNTTIASHIRIQREVAYCCDCLLKKINIHKRSLWDRKENNRWLKDSISHQWKKRYLPDSLSFTWLYCIVPLTPDGGVKGAKRTVFPESISLHCLGKLVTRAEALTGFQVTLICLSNAQWMTTVIRLQGLQAS